MTESLYTDEDLRRGADAWCEAHKEFKNPCTHLGAYSTTRLILNACLPAVITRWEENLPVGDKWFLAQQDAVIQGRKDAEKECDALAARLAIAEQHLHDTLFPEFVATCFHSSVHDDCASCVVGHVERVIQHYDALKDAADG